MASGISPFIKKLFPTVAPVLAKTKSPSCNLYLPLFSSLILQYGTPFQSTLFSCIWGSGSFETESDAHRIIKHSKSRMFNNYLWLRVFLKNWLYKSPFTTFCYTSSFLSDKRANSATFGKKSSKTQRIILIIRAASLSVPFLPQPHLGLPLRKI